MLLDEIFDKKELKFYKEISVRDNQTNSKINFPCFCILKNFLKLYKENSVLDVKVVYKNSSNAIEETLPILIYCEHIKFDNLGRSTEIYWHLILDNQANFETDFQCSCYLKKSLNFIKANDLFKWKMKNILF